LPTEVGTHKHSVRQPSPLRPDRSRISVSRTGTSTATGSHAWREHPRLLPFRYADLPHRSASGSRRRRGKPRLLRSSPKGPRFHPQPPEGDGAERTLHESSELLLPRSVANRQACSLPSDSNEAEATFAPPFLVRRPPEGSPLRGSKRRSRAQPPGNPEGPRADSRLVWPKRRAVRRATIDAEASFGAGIWR
jgi:hypothetical protein